jgi:RNA polymerase sigma factor for flagellar operon FliA
MPVQTIQDAWRRFRESRDDAARAEIIENYSYLVRITAQRVVTHLPPSLERDDLFMAGAMGLIKAVDQADPSRQVKFETYAIALIRGAILDYLREEDWVPRSIRERARKLQSARFQLEVDLGAPATEEQVADRLGISTDELARMSADTRRTSVVSLDGLLGDNSDGGERSALGELIADHAADPVGDVEMRECIRSLGAVIERLPERERLVITLYYHEGLTFKEIGKVLRISESRVYQLHTQAVQRMRGHLAGDKELFSH